MVREIEAPVPVGIFGGAIIPTYCTPTCSRSNCGFFGFTARMITRTTARTRSARNDSRRKRQQQHPFNDADEDERAGVLG